jgi:hypothetical protein
MFSKHRRKKKGQVHRFISMFGNSRNVNESDYKGCQTQLGMDAAWRSPSQSPCANRDPAGLKIKKNLRDSDIALPDKFLARAAPLV